MIHFLLLLPILTTAISLRGRKLTPKLAFIELFLFTALRYQFGNDYLNYYRSYQLIKEDRPYFANEPLFYWFCRLTPNFYVMVAIMSAIYVYALYKLITENIELRYTWMAMAILLVNPYIFLMDLSAMRQCMAIVMFLAAVHYAEQKNVIAYCIWVILAALFHNSAIVLLPVYWFLQIRKTKRLYVIAAIALIIVFLSYQESFMSLVEWVLGQLNIVNYNYYFETTTGNSLRSVVLSSIILFYASINLYFIKDKKTEIYTKLWFIALMCNVLSYRLSMFTRIEMYFSVFSVVAFPVIYLKNRRTPIFRRKFMNLLNNYVFPALICTIHILRYYSFFTTPLWEPFYTYHTILELL